MKKKLDVYRIVFYDYRLGSQILRESSVVILTSPRGMLEFLRAIENSNWQKKITNIIKMR